MEGSKIGTMIQGENWERILLPRERSSSEETWGKRPRGGGLGQRVATDMKVGGPGLAVPSKFKEERRAEGRLCLREKEVLVLWCQQEHLAEDWQSPSLCAQ